MRLDEKLDEKGRAAALEAYGNHVQTVIAAGSGVVVAEAIDAAITAYLASAAATAWRPPEGWRLVPVEPAEAMIDAASDFHANGNWNASDASVFGGIYRAMLSAAPPPPRRSYERHTERDRYRQANSRGDERGHRGD